jgi:hypothetical protein
MNKENQKLWFIFTDGQVSGPFSTAHVKIKINEGLGPESLIWDELKGQWAPIKTWAGSEPTAESAEWYYNFDGSQKGPLPLATLIQLIKDGEVPLTTKFWTAGLEQWVGLDSLPHIIEGAGLLRRKNLRAPLVGFVEVKGFPHENAVMTLSVSEEGVGLLNLTELGAGSKIMIKINSPLLKEIVESKAEILVQRNLNSSLKFHGLPSRAKVTLSEYIKNYKAS